MIHMMRWYDLTYTTYGMMQTDIAWLHVECYGMLFRYDLCLCVYVYIPWNYHGNVEGRAPWFDVVMMKIFDAIHGDKMWYDEMILK